MAKYSGIFGLKKKLVPTKIKFNTRNKSFEIYRNTPTKNTRKKSVFFLVIFRVLLRYMYIYKGLHTIKWKYGKMVKKNDSGLLNFLSSWASLYCLPEKIWRWAHKWSARTTGPNCRTWCLTRSRAENMARWQSWRPSRCLTKWLNRIGRWWMC